MALICRPFWRRRDVVGPGSAALIASGTAATALLLVALAARLWRELRDGPGSTESGRWSLVAASFCAVMAIVVLGKVLSPQFLIWFTPLLALLAGRRAWRAAGLLLGAMLLTSLDTGATYFHLVAGDPSAVAVVAIRNLLLAALLVILWRQVSTPAARSTRGGARRPRIGTTRRE